jgi:TetR/AcrR family transcriptional regulator, transcriptional repressor for nem operon
MLDHIETITRSHPQRREQALNTRDKLVQEGLRQVLERGWAATGIDAVLRECQVPKGSFYHYFASKEAFGYALLESYQASALQRLHAWFVQQPTASLEQLCAALDGFLEETVADMQRSAYQRGCLLGAMGQEVGAQHEGFRLQVHSHLSQWDEVLASALFNCSSSYAKDSTKAPKNSKQNGLLISKEFCLAWAQEFWAAWQGAMLRSVLARKPAALQAVVKRLQQQLMDMALAQRARSAAQAPTLAAQAKPADKATSKATDKATQIATAGSAYQAAAKLKKSLFDTPPTAVVKPVSKPVSKPKTPKKPKKISAVQVTLDF